MTLSSLKDYGPKTPLSPEELYRDWTVKRCSNLIHIRIGSESFFMNESQARDFASNLVPDAVSIDPGAKEAAEAMEARLLALLSP